MGDALRLGCLALYGVGPLVALMAVLRRRKTAKLDRVHGWRGWVPTILLPLEWLLPPALIGFDVGGVAGGHPLPQWIGFAVALTGAALLIWSAGVLGRFLVHDAAILDGHALVTRGPYR